MFKIHWLPGVAAHICNFISLGRGRMISSSRPSGEWAPYRGPVSKQNKNQRASTSGEIFQGGHLTALCLTGYPESFWMALIPLKASLFLNAMVV